MATKSKASKRKNESAPPATALAPPRFDVDDQEGLDFLEEHGFVVIKNVASPEEVSTAKNLMWDFLEGLGSGIDRNDVKTWENKNWPETFSTGIIGNHGIGQSPLLWFVRDLEKVKKVFSSIWQTDDLLVSFDGCNIFRPWKYEKKWFTKSGWYHLDQNSEKLSGRHCVQGILTLLDADENTGGLVLVPNSHKTHAEICKRSAKKFGHFVSINCSDQILRATKSSDPGVGESKNQVKCEISEGGPRLICCKSGDIVLWDSRVVHCNTSALNPYFVRKTKKKRQSPTSFFEKVSQKSKEGVSSNVHELKEAVEWDVIRAVCYICMTPRSKASSEVIDKRKAAFREQQTTSHYPFEYHPKKPPRWKRKGNVLKKPIVPNPLKLNQNQRQLVGY